MALGYQGHYGYFTGNIVSGTTKIEDLIITDSSKWMVIPETTVEPRGETGWISEDDLPHAHSVLSDSIQEWGGVTLMPAGNANQLAVDMCVNLLPSAFRNCPGLLSASLGGYATSGGFYMQSRRKFIGATGTVYNVGSTGILTQSSPSGADFFRMSLIGNSIYFCAQSANSDIEGGYLCEISLATGSRDYKIYANSASGNPLHYLTNTWTTLKTNAFGSDDPEWTHDPNEDDPYNPVVPGSGGSSKPGGGDGTFDFDSEDIVEMPDPSDFTSITGTDLVSIYTPTAAQLKSLAGFLWDTNFFTTISKIKTDPFDVLIGLSIVPVSLSGTPTMVKLGNVDTQIGMNKVSTQFHQVNCGGFLLNEIWGAYLDYKCRIEIYLPYIGFRPLSPDDVFGHLLSVKYNVDIVTGACMAYIMRDNECVAMYGGNCSYQIPLTGSNYSELVKGLLGVASSVGIGLATGGMAAPMAAGAVAGTSINTLTAKQDFQRSGGFGGNGGYMGARKPYLLIYAPNQCIPSNQNAIKGYPSYITSTLGSLSGMTIVDEIHLDGIGATDQEKDMIMAALKEGVIL